MDLEPARAILDRAHNAFVSIDEKGRVTYWNPRAEEIFGLTSAQVKGRLLTETIIPERYHEAHREGLRRLLRTGDGPVLNQRVELSALRADGSEFPVEITISVLDEGQRWSFHAFIADISERRHAEQERQDLLDDLQHALAGSEQRFEVILDALAEAVTIRGAEEQIVYANRAALDLLGFDSVEEVRAADPRALMGPYVAMREDGREINMDELPSVQLLRGERSEPLLMHSVNQLTGEEQWVLLKATAVRGAQGAVQAAVTIIEDVTAARRAQMRIEFLARTSEVLASSLDYQQTLRNVAGLAVPQIADWCGVDLFDEDGGREPVAVAHIDPGKVAMAGRLRAYEPEQLDPDTGLGRVWRTGEPMLYNEISDEMLVGAAVDDEHLALLRDVGMKAALSVPMTAQGRTIGALTLVSAESGRSFDKGDVEFAGQIAERAARAVENAQLYSERSEIARTLQQSLLPDALPEIAGWEVAALYRPTGHGNEVGGDFYDVWQAEGDWLMMMGDVTGKGVGAAAVTSLVRHSAWMASDFDARPAEILGRVDGSLKRRPSLSICTALCLRISGGRGTIAVGGHPLPLHLSRGEVREIGCHGPLLGALDGARWMETEFTMEEGETLVAITDGVTDTVGEDGMRFGSERLREALAGMEDERPEAIRDRLVAALEDFQVGVQADDTAIVVMRFTGTATETEGAPRIASHRQTSQDGDPEHGQTLSA